MKSDWRRWLAALICCTVSTSTFADFTETWESQTNLDPFAGVGDVAWVGDVGDFEVTSATWPSGSTPDFAGSRSLRSRDTGGTTSTVVTSLTFNSALATQWSVYVGGNSAEISSVRDFAIVLLSDSSNQSDIESGSVNGYRLQLRDDPDVVGTADEFRLEVATGGGWVKLIGIDLGVGTNVNEGWNIAAQRTAGGQWTFGFTNGVIGQAVTLGNAIIDTSVTSGSFAGVTWRSSNTDDNDFGFDNFSYTNPAVIPEPATAALLGAGVLLLVRGRTRQQ